MELRALTCPKCGAALPPEARRRVVVCGYCGVSVFLDRLVVKAGEYRKSFERAIAGAASDLRIGDRCYRLLGRIAEGASSDVFLADRVYPLAERVIVKVLRARGDANVLETEHRALAALAGSEARGTDYFRGWIPEVVAFGRVQDETLASPTALVTRYPSGFVHTLEDLRRVYPAGVDPRHGVWITRRLSALLGWVHESGWVHGSVLPEHVLIHARDHGARLVGWSCARRGSGGAATAQDVRMAARCVAYALGGGIEGLPEAVPHPIAELVLRYARGGGDARAFGDDVGEVAAEVYGPPAFVHLAMPGWS